MYTKFPILSPVIWNQSFKKKIVIKVETQIFLEKAAPTPHTLWGTMVSYCMSPAIWNLLIFLIFFNFFYQNWKPNISGNNFAPTHWGTMSHSNINPHHWLTNVSQELCNIDSQQQHWLPATTLIPSNNIDSQQQHWLTTTLTHSISIDSQQQHWLTATALTHSNNIDSQQQHWLDAISGQSVI